MNEALHPALTAQPPGNTVPVMGYAEGYMMTRHKGAMPFVWAIKDAVTMLEQME